MKKRVHKNKDSVNALTTSLAVGLVVFVLHPFFHLWIYLSPGTYAFMVRLFFPGFSVVITPLDTSIPLTILSTFLKSFVFGFVVFIVIKIKQLLKSKID